MGQCSKYNLIGWILCCVFPCLGCGRESVRFFIGKLSKSLIAIRDSQVEAVAVSSWKCMGIVLMILYRGSNYGERPIRTDSDFRVVVVFCPLPNVVILEEQSDETRIPRFMKSTWLSFRSFVLLCVLVSSLRSSSVVSSLLGSGRSTSFRNVWVNCLLLDLAKLDGNVFLAE